MNEQIISVAIADLRPSPLNPRKHLGDLTELTASVREKGVLEPVPDGQHAAAVAGVRRRGRLMAMEGHRSDYPFLNFVRALLGLDPIPFTTRGFREGEQWVEAIGTKVEVRWWTEERRDRRQRQEAG